MTPTSDYLEKCRELLVAVAAQEENIQRAAEWFAEAIASGRVVHLFGSGHSRIAVEEMWPRYGSFPGFHPIVELSLTYHNQVVGANGQRQAMYLENVAGFAERILRNFDISGKDAALVVSSSGCNRVPIEVAELLRAKGVRVVAIVGRRHAEASSSRHPKGLKLHDIADLVLDTGVPPGDAMVAVDGLETPVSPGSTLAAVALVNAIKCEVADRLTKAGAPPRVLTAPCLVGAERSAELSEAAYDEHAHRVARILENVGRPRS